VDPLDGTTSFVHGYPFYGISIALLREGRPMLGVVHNVPSGETFAAARGMGATLDGRSIHCSTARSLDEALFVTGFPYDRTRTLQRQLADFAEIMKTAHGVRRDGSAALDC
jgi:myo-inositol-1(or 4)-monophosphatase